MQVAARVLRWTIRLALLVAAALCASADGGAATLWLAGPERIVGVDAGSGQLTETIELPGAQAIAANAGGGAWAVAEGALHHVSAGGRALHVDVEALGYGGATRLAVDAYDDSAWVATQANLLAHFDVGGRLLAGYALPASAAALALGLDETVWVAGDRAVWHVSPRPGMLAAMALPAGWEASVAALVVDSLRDRVWIVGTRGIAVTAIDGSTRWQEVAGAPEEIRASTLDPLTGTLWVLAEETLIRCDAERGCRTDEATVTDAARASSLQYDAASDALVLVSPGAVEVLLRKDGAFVRLQDQRFAVVPDDAQVSPALVAATTPLRLLPEIALLHPPAERTTFDRQSGFVLGLDTRCNDMPCRPPDEYTAGVRLFASLDGASVAKQFRLDALTGRLEFTPASPLPVGRTHFSAHAVDRFGHRSNTIEADVNVAASGRESLPDGNQAPTVSISAPANNAKFVAGDNIVLTASAADADGTITQVDFYRGGSVLLGTAKAAPYSVTWSSVPAGTYSLTAKATDNANATKTSTSVNISVTAPPNSAPKVTIASPPDGAIVNGSSVTIRATATDSDGKVGKVEFYDGPVLLGSFAGGASTVDASWTIAKATTGAHLLKAVAVDNANATASATVAITVNAPPVAVMTSPRNCASFDAPADLTLAADVLDPDGAIARVDFYQGTLFLGAATAAPYAIAWPGVVAGTYTLTAVAVDNAGASGKSNPVTVTVNVPNVPPSVSMTAPADGTTIGVGAAVAVSAIASDGDGSIAKVEFLAGTSVIGTTQSLPYGMTWVPTAAGSFALTARATDNRGAVRTSSPVQVTVVTNKLPAVMLTAPSGGASFIGPATVNLAANASDTDGTIARVEFFAGSTLVGTAASPPYTATWTNVAAGSYSITARAIDNLGGRATSAAASITVDRPPAVTIVSPADNVYYAAGTELVIVAHATDADGTIGKVSLSAASKALGVALSLGSCTPSSAYSDFTCTFTWKGAQPDAYAFTATAVDNLGAATSSAPLHVTVNSPLGVTLMSPVDGATFAYPATVNLAASVSQTFGSVAKVDYFAGATLIGSATVAPFNYAWTNVPQGAYTLTARATDNAGATGTSSPISISVDPVALNITSPLPGAEIYADTAAVTGTFGGGTPSSITVNGLNAQIGDGTFGATVPLIAGSNTITAVAAIGNATATRSVIVSKRAPQIIVADLPSGTTIHDDNVTLQGFVYAPVNSAVFVNGRPASMDIWGHFIANDVALVPGSNTIKVTLNGQDIASSQQSIAVTSDAVAPFGVKVEPDHGMGPPLEVTVTLVNRNLTPYAWLAVNGTKFQAPAPPAAEQSVTVTYTRAGTFSMSISARDAAGNIMWNTTRLVQILPPTDRIGRLQHVYTGMLDRLRAGNVDVALSAVTDTVYDKYKAIFTALGPSLSAAIDQLGSIEEVTVGDDVGELSIVRSTPTGPQRFLVYLVKGDDGLWRIDGM